jgi:hypothetical protein
MYYSSPHSCYLGAPLCRENGDPKLALEETMAKNKFSGVI